MTHTEYEKHTEYKKLLPVGELPQTRVTWTKQIDFGGLIPKSVVNGQAVNSLMYLSERRRRFHKSLETDNSTSS